MNLQTLSVSISNIWDKAWPILLAILFFGVIIALHEFGHFITAKLFKVKVNEFAIGMGPALFKKRPGQKIRFLPQIIEENKATKQNPNGEASTSLPEGVGETEYSLRLLPIGGYCALEGENGDSEDTCAFCSKKPWKRFIILAAGATLNILLGLVLVCIMLFSEETAMSNKISYVSDAISVAEDSLQVGDTIIAIDGTRVYSTRDLSYCLFYRADSETGADITVKRNGEKITVENFKYVDTDTSDATYFAVSKHDVTLLNCGVFAVRETAAMAKLVLLSLIDLFSGQFGLNDLSGPIGTVNIVAQTTTVAVADKDYASVLFLLAFITINIGLVNLMPLPALDGGRLFFVLIEMIIRKPVPQKFEAIVHAVGMILLLALMAFICFNDIKNLIVN